VRLHGLSDLSARVERANRGTRSILSSSTGHFRCRIGHDRPSLPQGRHNRGGGAFGSSSPPPYAGDGCRSICMPIRRSCSHGWGESTNRASIWHPCHQAGAREYVFVLFSSSLTEDDIGLARGF
jgi:hypothetical protein